MKFNICVAVPIKSSDLEQNTTIIKKILTENPEFIELRFDYIDNKQKLTREFVEKLLKIIQTNTRAIFTMRDSSEGGQMELNNHERVQILETLIQAQPEYLDIEMNSDMSILKQIISLAVKNKVNLIFSNHDFEETQNYEKTVKIIDSFTNRLKNELKTDSKIVDTSIYKIIFTAQNFEDNLIPLKVCKYFSEKNRKVICFCMGELGIFSRVSCVKSGSFLTYGSFEDKTAPGQINISKMRKFHQLLFNNS